ncbi:MAG: hypothetical protein DDT40_01670 [candidate division WS2 bacterium]|nr:hypothetical protein [Candidatus Psychracetigena formicireducens]
MNSQNFSHRTTGTPCGLPLLGYSGTPGGLPLLGYSHLKRICSMSVCMTPKNHNLQASVGTFDSSGRGRWRRTYAPTDHLNRFYSSGRGRWRRTYAPFSHLRRSIAWSGSKGLSGRGTRSLPSSPGAKWI